MATAQLKETISATDRENRDFLPVCHDERCSRRKSAYYAQAPAETRRKRPLTRPLAPFLAQLSLQYDDISAARRKRRERLEAATRSYAGAGAELDSPVRGRTQDLRT